MLQEEIILRNAQILNHDLFQLTLAWWYFFTLDTLHLSFKQANSIFVYIVTGWLYCASMSSSVAQNVARQLSILMATKFIDYTY